MRELWKPVPYEPFGSRYSISNIGRVRVDQVSRYSANKTEFLKSAANKRGYLQVTLYYQGHVKCISIHQMVALAFLGPPPAADSIVCHKNDCKTDNISVNLEWGTNKSNALTREMIGNSTRGEKNGMSQLNAEKVRRIRARYAAGGVTQCRLAEEFGIKVGAIGCVLRRATWRHVR